MLVISQSLPSTQNPWSLRNGSVGLFGVIRNYLHRIRIWNWLWRSSCKDGSRESSGCCGCSQCWMLPPVFFYFVNFWTGGLCILFSVFTPHGSVLKLESLLILRFILGAMFLNSSRSIFILGGKHTKYNTVRSSMWFVSKFLRCFEVIAGRATGFDRYTEEGILPFHFADEDIPLSLVSLKKW